MERREGSWVDVEHGARSFVSHIEEVTNASLRAGIVKGADRENLEYALGRLRPAFDEIVKSWIDPIREDQPFHANFCFEKIWELTASAFLAGSRGTVSETATRLPRSEAGKKSGAARRLGAEEGWRPHALSLAQLIREEEPSLSQRKVASQIILRWRLQIPCPETQLVAAISAWEKSGVLKRRNT